nr:immunoglobulin heavy chain junction region [Macaca mulatta]MOX58917.1 immunoglobulin heavy chain junction region [Macaca mulatta]MOX58937.1 immunoglobulin heavy chain junction region [Macaca mulatta]MOX59716.1 immunoglobulin heavy chain junction region [Macaca mulatta]MOX62224.1 immunoglobulin heavy chain junction region [Macaca mulatta]
CARHLYSWKGKWIDVW